MSDPFVGEIRCFGFPFAPRYYAACNGQTVPLQQNAALFSVIGTFYGGDGTTNFALPNLQGRAACSTGGAYGLGQAVGSAAVTLDVTQLAPHGHTFTSVVSSVNTATNAPAGGSHLGRTFGQRDFSTAPPDTTLAQAMIGAAGGGQAHANQQPYLAINFCIALQGTYPQRP